jgi:hypothetical protein
MIKNEKFNGDTGRSMRHPEEIEGDSKWEMQGDLEKTWRDPGEIGDGRYRKIRNEKFNGDWE